jgi:hypothetical protein
MNRKLIAAVTALAALAATPALAQQAPATHLQISPYAGAFIPTGAQRDVLDAAFLTGLTLSLELDPYLAFVGSFGWAASQGQQPITRDRGLDVYQYDLGLQGQRPFALGRGVTLKPFVGIGTGVRTYDFADGDLASETDFVGYVSAGASLEYRHVALGLTVRDYLSIYDGIAVDEGSSTRNDLSVYASLGARF